MDDNDEPKLFRLYVLRLEDGKYYVGVTTKTVEQRMKEHASGRSAYWTHDHKPVSIYHQEELGVMTYPQAQELEQAAVQRYMKELGLNNVRGGELTDREDYGLIGNRILIGHERNAFVMIFILLAIIVVLALLLRLEY